VMGRSERVAIAMIVAWGVITFVALVCSEI